MANSLIGLSATLIGVVTIDVSADSESDSVDRLLGEAAGQAVQQIVTQLAEVTPKLADLPPVLPIEEMVIADVTDNQVILNKGGKMAFFRPGMVLSVERVIQEIKDPVTGKLLQRQTQPIGRLQLIEVESLSSVGTILAGEGFKVGDRAKAIERN